MGERDKSEGRDFERLAAERAAAAAERARKLEVLGRVAAALGVPVESFFDPAPPQEAGPDDPEGGARA
ncbi:hypothetical protein Q8W71_19870 [Methylobacterium sp. NEAU 140]|uniref:hypothetical protein n=1 Tax=Methylobacterium sp. NEAU 140 TaxID=3064945 RepID=UPI0027373E15|nr:hypothetical protein [Methylobacterium sp. NEAU 140]MDP4024892.1 hypothetical protein [Methylobacterium sp. NEAU 140]